LLLRPWSYKSYWILGRPLGRKVVPISPVIPFGFCPTSLRKAILGGGGYYSLIFRGEVCQKGKEKCKGIHLFQNRPFKYGRTQIVSG